MIWFLPKSTLIPHLPYYRYTLLSICSVSYDSIIILESFGSSNLWDNDTNSFDNDTLGTGKNYYQKYHYKLPVTLNVVSISGRACFARSLVVITGCWGKQ